MNMTEATGHIANMLIEKKNVTAQEISYQHKIALVQIYAIMKKLETSGAVKRKDTDNNKIFTLVDEKKLRMAIEVTEQKLTDTPAKKTTKTAEPDKPVKVAPAGRDTSKYKFQGQELPKGQCALAVVRAHMQSKKITLAALRETFPDEIIGRFGVVNTLSEAKKLSQDRPRYFMKDTDILKTSDGKQVVVCSQWTTERFIKFLSISRKIGHKITKA